MVFLVAFISTLLQLFYFGKSHGLWISETAYTEADNLTIYNLQDGSDFYSMFHLVKGALSYATVSLLPTQELRIRSVNRACSLVYSPISGFEFISSLSVVDELDRIIQLNDSFVDLVHFFPSSWSALALSAHQLTSCSNHFSPADLLNCLLQFPELRNGAIVVVRIYKFDRNNMTQTMSNTDANSVGFDSTSTVLPTLLPNTDYPKFLDIFELESGRGGMYSTFLTTKASTKPQETCHTGNPSYHFDSDCPPKLDGFSPSTTIPSDLNKGSMTGVIKKIAKTAGKAATKDSRKNTDVFHHMTSETFTTKRATKKTLPPWRQNESQFHISDKPSKIQGSTGEVSGCDVPESLLN